MALRMDHIYLCVRDLDRAIRFYEGFFETKVSLRQEDRWAQFESNGSAFLALYNPTYDGGSFRCGTNAIPVFFSTRIEEDYQKVRALGPGFMTELLHMDHHTPYKFFQFEDSEGNVVEVCQYTRRHTSGLFNMM
jgi:lactoylglutathione lyase